MKNYMIDASLRSLQSYIHSVVVEYVFADCKKEIELCTVFWPKIPVSEIAAYQASRTSAACPSLMRCLSGSMSLAYQSCRGNSF